MFEIKPELCMLELNEPFFQVSECWSRHGYVYLVVKECVGRWTVLVDPGSVVLR